MSFRVYTAPTADQFLWRFLPYAFVLTGWMQPLYAILYDHVLPRMRGLTSSLYLLLMTILGLGIGPCVVGFVSDATGDLRFAMLSINAAAIPIVVRMVLIGRRAHRDQLVLLARAAG